ncbi:MAG TPA: LLM class flavin-dependent oxidoreductase [Allosphingosinicella sp.]|nr:LLM class flavin-dependent oxidoreductase [Allosphingosinicella sp.]
MEFGIFDHCERAPRPAATTYEERFRLAQRAEAAGFYAYHLAEHHGTPLSLVPSPNLFLAALAQRTSTLRLGPLVYLLPLYEPYRLVEEICMLDNLCGGRLELGVGRGANPVELGFFGLDPAGAKDRFDEAFKIIMQGLIEGQVTHQGEHYDIGHGPVDGRTVQRPHPPIWYPSAGGGASLAWAAAQGFNTIVNGTLEACVDAVKVFWDNFKPGAHGASPRVGITRYVFVADTEEEAFRVGDQAFSYHLKNLTKLTDDMGMTLKSPIIPPNDLREAVACGWAAVGSPQSVREQIAAIVDTVGVNYFVFAPMIGDLSGDWGLRTIDLFESEIMPSFQSEMARPAVLKA